MTPREAWRKGFRTGVFSLAGLGAVWEIFRWLFK